MRYEKTYTLKQPMTKDSVHKKVTGVCAGIAKHYQLPRLCVRIAAVIAFFNFPVVVGVAYVVASILMPNRY